MASGNTLFAVDMQAAKPPPWLYVAFTSGSVEPAKGDTIWGDTSNTIDRRTDLSSHPWQIYSKFTLGATRVEESKIVEIECNEA